LLVVVAFTPLFGPNGEVDGLKARLVAKGYTHIYDLDYGDTFFAAAKMTNVSLVCHDNYTSLTSPSIRYKKCFPS